MKRLATAAISGLLAICLAKSQVQAPNATVQATHTQHSQEDNGTREVPRYYSHPRQVLVTASVWKRGAKSAAWVPPDVLKRHPIAGAMASLPVARGLSANDFQVFDNGAEQKINYIEETDSSAMSGDEKWIFYSDPLGTWGFSIPSNRWLDAPAALYVIGYVPPASQSDDCHTIRVVAGDNEVQLNRSCYCNSVESETSTAEERKLASKMEAFANSTSHGSFKVSSRPLVFWSSRVLSLLEDKPVGVGSTPSAASYTYTVVVHDSKAPATVQIATEYELEMNEWENPCPHSHPAIHVLGVVSKANGEVAARFGDSHPCTDLVNSVYSYWSGESETIPTRFNSQVELQPGDYNVHVVVSDGHKFGQTRMPLRVEAIDSQSLAISDIAVNGILRDTSWLLPQAAMVSPAPLLPTPLVSKHAQFIPVANARLPKGSSLPLYFELYEPLLADRSTEVYFRIRITDLKEGALVMNTPSTSAAQSVTQGNVVVPIALKVDTDKLQSGTYKIEVQASDSAGHTSEWRMAKFEIQ